MAKVPRYEGGVQQEGPSGARQQVSTPGDAFGGGIGAGLAQIGGQLQQHADQMQRRMDQTSADEAFLEFTKQRNQLLFMDEGAFYNLNGKDAVDAYNPTVEKLEQLRKQFGAQLNPVAAGLFRNATDRDIAFSINNMASHSSKALRSWEKQTAESFLENHSNDMAMLGSEEEYLTREQEGIDYLFANADKLGLDDPQTFQKEAKEWMSNARLKRVGVMANEDPVGALEYAKEHREEFNPEAYSRLITNLQGRADPILARQAAETAVGELSGTAVVSFDNEVDRLIDEREGEVLHADNNGADTKFGINQEFNPDIDVKNLTRTQAKKIYKERYWDAVGADQQPDHMKVPAFDAAVNQGVGRTKKWLEQANGDLAVFNALRLEAYKKHPDWNKYKKAWTRRIQESSTVAPPKKAIDVRANLPLVHAAIDANPNLTERQKDLAKSDANGIISNKVIETQATQANYMEVAYSIAIGGPTGEGAPTSLAAAMENPDFSRAYLGLDTRSQDFIRTQITQNSRRLNPPITAEFLDLEAKFKTWASTSPESFPSQEDIMASATAAAEAGNPWPNSILRSVLSLRTGIIKGEVKELSMSTRSAVNLPLVKMEMEKAGLLKKGKVPKGKQEEYAAFVGRVDAHIKAYQSVFKKNPSEAEISNYVGQLIVERNTFFGLGKKSEFETEEIGGKVVGTRNISIVNKVPDGVIPQIVQDLKELGITRPTPAQIRQMFEAGQGEAE